MRHKHGGDVYSVPGMLDFSANINPLGMPKEVKDAAIKGIEQAVSYPEVSSKHLRKQLSEYYNINPEYVICGNGAAEIIFYICLASQPKKALLLAPSFAEYEISLRNVGCEITYYDLKEENDFKLKTDYITCLRDDLDILFLCNPNNPTGQMISKEFLLEVIKVCEEKQIRVVIDECFIDFSDELEKQSLRDEFVNYDNLVIINAFTKLYAMPGLRLGYALSSDEVLCHKMQQLLQPWNVSVPAQLAGIAALKEKEYVMNTREMLRKEKEYLLDYFLNKNESVRSKEGCSIDKVYGHEANYIFFRSDINLYDNLYARGIQIRDCSNYRGLEKGYYRIAVRNRFENQRLIEAMFDIGG